jgi:hypothetical protein
MPSRSFLLGLTLVAGMADTPAPVVTPLPPPDLSVTPLLRDEPLPGLTSISLRELGLSNGRDPLRASSTNPLLLGTLTCQQTVRDGDIGTVWDDPSTRRGWQADEDYKLGLLGPLFVFGQASAAAEDALRQDARLNGRTGVGVQVPVPAGELLFRGGTNVTYSDPLRQERAKERSEMLLEVKGRYPLLFGINLEFQGSASPALSPLDHDWVSEEVRLALPLGGNGQFHFGARQRWENVVEQRPTSDGTQLFLGLEFKH